MFTNLSSRRMPLIGSAMLAVAMVASACSSSGISQQTYDAKEKELAAKAQEVAAKEKEVAGLQQQLAAKVPTTLVQGGQLQPAQGPAVVTGWENDESRKGGLRILATYDSNGPDAWSAAEHPLVFASTDGVGYNSLPLKGERKGGLMVVDANTKKVVASALYDVGEPWAEGVMSSGHALGISPDGKWFYFGYIDTPRDTKKNRSVFLIINARTLKLHMALTHPGGLVHHTTAFKDWKGRDRILLQTGPIYLLDPNDNHKVVKAITGEEVPLRGHPYSIVDPTGKFLFVGMRSAALGEAGGPAGVAKYNMETGALTQIWGVGDAGSPIGKAITADGKLTYVNDAENSRVYVIDNEKNEVIRSVSAGVAGPYGMALNWDESELYIVGKGEGTHNTGGVLGVLFTKPVLTSPPGRAFNQPIVLGGSASSVDHAILHPDPAVNEMWISNMYGWEIIVLDLNTRKTKAYIPTPNSGTTHSGGFIRYKPDWSGELLADMGGPKKAVLDQKLAIAASAKK